MKWDHCALRCLEKIEGRPCFHSGFAKTRFENFIFLYFKMTAIQLLWSN